MPEGLDLIEDPNPLGTMACRQCKGTGRLNIGQPKSDWPALDFLGGGEEVCNDCAGRGQIPKSPQESFAGFTCAIAGNEIPVGACGSFVHGYHAGARERRRVSGQSWAIGKV